MQNKTSRNCEYKQFERRKIKARHQQRSTCRRAKLRAREVNYA